MKLKNSYIAFFVRSSIDSPLYLLALSLAAISCSQPTTDIIRDYPPDAVDAPDVQFGNDFAEDGNWPEPYIRPGEGPKSWNQVRARIDSEDTYDYWSSTDEVIAEFSDLHDRTQVWLSTYNEAEHVFTIEFYEPQLWPFKAEYSLDRETTRGYHTNVFMREGLMILHNSVTP